MATCGAFTVFAAPAKVDLSVSAVDGHTYTAYQLFVGDLSEDGKTLSNVKWGSDVKTTEITYNTDKKVTPEVGGVVPQEVLDYLSSLSSKANPVTETTEGVAQATADIIAGWVNDSKGFTITSDATQVDTGYYVVKDAYTNTDPNAAQTTTLSTVICEVVGPTTITPKAGTTEHKKEVLDINDTTETALDLSKLKDVDVSKWNSSADHDFGDHVPFKLTTTIGSDFAKYSKYYLAVSDTLKDGLKLDQSSIEVYVDGVKATEGSGDGEYVLTKGDKSFKVEFTKLNGNTNAAAGKDVVIYYTATLDKDTAVIGNPGNWNESFAEFSNNPNGDQSGKGKTPTATAVVFTYNTIVNKVDKDKNPLKGAEFTLTKTLKNGSTVEVAVLRFDKDGHAVTTASTASTAADGTTFSFNGLDDGTYTLTETVTPNGYNTIDPVTFQIVASHKKDATTGLESLVVKNADGSDFSGNLTFTSNLSDGSLTTDVVNNKGAVLPSTGGSGTTMLYIIGVILLAGAAILLVTKRRMNAE